MELRARNAQEHSGKWSESLLETEEEDTCCKIWCPRNNRMLHSWYYNDMAALKRPEEVHLDRHANMEGEVS